MQPMHPKPLLQFPHDPLPGLVSGGGKTNALETEKPNFNFSAYSLALKSSMVISQEALNYLASGHGLRHEQDLWVVLRAGTVLHAPAHCAAGLRHFGHRYLHRASCSSTQQGPWPSPTLWYAIVVHHPCILKVACLAKLPRAGTIHRLIDSNMFETCCMSMYCSYMCKIW
ncbi:hypothetical protein PAHAL_9G305300 [Panicum hallii]|uniref:Uncharacterized protein n=1 Tax=Panicum hallii TaxID=206008 RepID=A0A2T8I353_9POAL|nr:hypothetical protein PAHAL_9G305300 [Panicum hallii]PVH32069.1 hypothetical protein PAHAL_9G305300 [Panicum hallii]